jgi:SAM-dependent methyltransferase
MPPVMRYHWDTPEYANAFAALVRASHPGARPVQVLRELLQGYPPDSRAIDWGAGAGDLTAVLLERFRQVWAVEPNPEQRAVLARRCPAAQVIAGTIASAPPEPVEVGVISHVFYHIPDHKWGAYVVRAAQHLRPGGTLLVVLADPDSDISAMLEHFGAPGFDLYAGLAATIRGHRELDFCFRRTPGPIRTTSLEETLTIARFMLCDRDEDAFSRPPTEEEFQAYVREHFWDEQAGTGGWEHGSVYCLVRPNALYEHGM